MILFSGQSKKHGSVRFLTDINVSVNGGFLQSVGVLGHFAAKKNCPLDLDLEYVDCRGQFLQEIEGPMCGALWRSSSLLKWAAALSESLCFQSTRGGSFKIVWVHWSSSMHATSSRRQRIGGRRCRLQSGSMEDSITAITMVALGTSVPDLFASKEAACGDPYADASIGNVTGSNSVNVFLGIKNVTVVLLL